MQHLFHSLAENKAYIVGSISSWILTGLSFHKPMLFIEASYLVPYAQLLALTMGSVVSGVTLMKILKDWDKPNGKK